jgi:hypothetical protein
MAQGDGIMGCQGEIYVIYGVEVDAKLERQVKRDENPVLYSINGHMLYDDNMGDFAEDAELYNGVQGPGYGAADLTKKLELTTRVLGHSSWMGSRHFDGKALVGYGVGNECYMDSSSPLPPMDDIKALAPKLVAEIKKKLGLDINPDQLRLHLLFDSLNGM